MTRGQDDLAVPSTPRLGTLEAQVMNVLWDNAPSTVREIITHLPGEPAYTTIATVLTNLRRKGLVTVSREIRTTRYTASVSRDEHAAQLMAQALASSRDRKASILRFVDGMPDDDLALLREYLEQRPPGGIS